MSAPPPPGPGTRAYRGVPAARVPQADAVTVAALFASAARARQQRPSRRPQRPQAYARPDDPRGLVLTADQWARYDKWQALCDRMDTKYGHLRSVAALMNRSMW